MLHLQIHEHVGGILMLILYSETATVALDYRDSLIQDLYLTKL